MDSFPERLLHFVSNLVSEYSLHPLHVRICLSIYVNEYLITSNYCCNLRAKKKVKILFNPMLSYFRNSNATAQEQHIDKLLSVGHWCKDTNREKNGVLEEKPLPVPLVSTQTSHGLTWGRNRTSTLKAQKQKQIIRVFKYSFLTAQ